MRPIFFLVFVVSFFFIACGQNKKEPEFIVPEMLNSDVQYSLLGKYLDSLTAIRKFNGAVLIAKGDSALFIKTNGFADHTLNNKVDNNSFFRLASISKQFTASAIMKLHQEGYIDYNDKVIKHIPEFPYSDVTIRSLLTHTSGMPDKYLDLASKHRNDFEDPLSVQDVVKLFEKYKPKKKKGLYEEFSYNNSGYVLLSALVEAVSGQNLEEYLGTNILDSLEINNCRIWNLMSADTIFEGKTSSFRYQGETAIALKPNFVDGVSGDGAVFCTIEGFLKWNNMWIEQDFFDREMYIEAFKGQKLIDGSHSRYGFGWNVKDNKISHSGGWLGARTYSQIDLENGYSMVILDNSANNHSGNIMAVLIRFMERFE